MNSSCEEEDEGVLSEVHIRVKPPTTEEDHQKYISRFPITLKPQESIIGSGVEGGAVHESKTSAVNEEGDCEVPRRKKQKVADEVITIIHRLDTPLKSVGMQVWRGALVLGDYLLHNQYLFKDCVGLELGAGSGFAGMILSRVAKRCFITDYDSEILQNCNRNVKVNSHLFYHDSVVKVRRFDWLDPLQKLIFCDIDKYKEITSQKNKMTEFDWTEEDLQELQQVSIVLAADVIYSPELSDAFLDRLRYILKNNCKCLLSIEKRINFTVDELSVTAPAYDYLMQFLKVVDTDHTQTNNNAMFNAKKIPICFPKYLDYDRVGELEIWEITQLNENK